VTTVRLDIREGYTRRSLFISSEKGPMVPESGENCGVQDQNMNMEPPTGITWKAPIDVAQRAVDHEAIDAE
jgi:hypothetical protein